LKHFRKQPKQLTMQAEFNIVNILAEDTLTM